MTSTINNFDVKRSAFVVLATALILRVVWVMIVPVVPISDGKAYDIQAQMLAEHGTYGFSPDQPSAAWPVGTSAIYALFYKVFGHNYLPVEGLNIALSVAIICLTMRLGCIFFDERTAIIAGALLALWPSQIAYVTILASELPFMFFMMLGIVAWYEPRLGTLSRIVICGLTIGAATYIRAVSLLLPIVLWFSSAPDWRRMRARLPIVAVVMIMIALMIVPWSVRNTKLFGHFVLLSTNGGVVFWMGNNPDSDGFYMPIPAATEGFDEYSLEKVLSTQAWQYITERPLAFVARTAKKAGLLYIGETIAVHWNAEGITERFGERALLPLKIITQGYWMLMLMLGVVGLYLMYRKNGLVPTLFHPITLFLLYFTGVYAVTIVGDRFHFPSHPVLALLAAVAVVRARIDAFWLTRGSVSQIERA